LDGAVTNKDHVVPRSLVCKDLRDPPLVLMVHKSCNSGWSKADDLLGQLFAGHNERGAGRDPKSGLTVLEFKSSGQIPAFKAVGGLDLVQIVWRMVRGMHAALYTDFLPASSKFEISLPFPTIDERGCVVDSLRPIHSVVASQLYLARRSGIVDQVVVYNGAVRYICAWDRLDDGRSCCMFALQIHEWENAVDTRLGPRAGCVGLYVPRSGRPRQAQKCPRVDFVGAHAVLSPFEDL